jgi:hypothetical protein
MDRLVNCGYPEHRQPDRPAVLGGGRDTAAVARHVKSDRSPSLNGDQPAARSRLIGVGAVTGRGDRDGSICKEVAMRPIRTIAPLALGLLALAVAGCQSRPDQPTASAPFPFERVTPTTTAPDHQTRPPSRPPATAPKPTPAPAPETIVGLWPVRTLEQARALQDRADAGQQPWLLSPELVATSYAAAELDLYQPVARRVGPNAYEVGATGSEWAAKLYLAQPVRQGAGGIWVVTRIASPMESY